MTEEIKRMIGSPEAEAHESFNRIHAELRRLRTAVVRLRAERNLALRQLGYTAKTIEEFDSRDNPATNLPVPQHIDE